MGRQPSKASGPRDLRKQRRSRDRNEPQIGPAVCLTSRGLERIEAENGEQEKTCLNAEAGSAFFGTESDRLFDDDRDRGLEFWQSLVSRMLSLAHPSASAAVPRRGARCR